MKLQAITEFVTIKFICLEDIKLLYVFMKIFKWMRKIDVCFLDSGYRKEVQGTLLEESEVAKQLKFTACFRDDFVFVYHLLHQIT